MDDKVICRICGKGFLSLEGHLFHKHKLSSTQYLIDFPGEKIRALSVVKKQQQTLLARYGVMHNSQIPEVKVVHSEKCREFYSSPEGLLMRKQQALKRNQTMLERYGRLSTTSGRQKTVEEKENQKQGVFKKYGTSNVAQVPWIKDKILKSMRRSQGQRPTKLEELVMQLVPSNVKYTGDWKVWVHFLNGKRKNPDFIVEPFEQQKKVIEVNSFHYHTLEETDRTTKEYYKVGIQCLVVWMEELKNPTELRKKISDFVQAPPQRLQTKLPEKEDGIV